MSAWPILEPAALYGLAGEVVAAISPESEADPAALLATFLTCYGNAVGGGPHAQVGGAQHAARLNTLIVGDTARSRKGQSRADTQPIFTYADPAWCDRILNGFGSGEAVIDAVRDACGDDPGAEDKRALIFEPEFVRILRVVRRDGVHVGFDHPRGVGWWTARGSHDRSRCEGRDRSACLGARAHHGRGARTRNA